MNNCTCPRCTVKRQICQHFLDSPISDGDGKAVERWLDGAISAVATVSLLSSKAGREASNHRTLIQKFTEAYDRALQERRDMVPETVTVQ